MKKDCLLFRDLCDESLLQELVPDARRALEDHLKTCANCRLYHQRGLALEQALNRFGESEAAYAQRLDFNTANQVMERILPSRGFLGWKLAIAFCLVFFAVLNFVTYGPDHKVFTVPQEKAVSRLLCTLQAGIGELIDNDSSSGASVTQGMPLNIPYNFIASTPVCILIESIGEMRLKPGTGISVTSDEIKIQGGTVHFSSGKLPFPMQIVHDLGKITIIGTKLLIQADTGQMRVSLLEGRIQVENRFDRRMLTAGEETVLESDTYKIPVYELEKWISEIHLDPDRIFFTAAPGHDTMDQPVQEVPVGAIPSVRDEFRKLEGSPAAQ
ncbi:MAG: hypothetical protein PHQ23_00405 [Candidatus Wallbacteria bacterium]|nr:hypothetical protein [Candidatus Wallbacteria bacterium]